MKRICLFVILALINFYCSTAKPVEPVQIQARLLKVETERLGKYFMTLVSMQGDTVYCKYGMRGIGKARFEYDTWYTIQYDSAGNRDRYVRALIRKNN
jgi:hypothetical protein